MTWQLFLQSLRAGSFFRELGKLGVDELADRLQWARLLTTDRLWRWLRQDDWAFASAIPNGDEVINPTLAILLERHLLNLDTRFNPQPLLDFWDWVMRACQCTGKVAGLWRDRESVFRACCGTGEVALADIVTQEKTFAGLLRDAEGVLRDVPKLRWACDSVGRLAARRSGGEAGRVARRSHVRVVFALEGACPVDLRPALLVDFELRTPGLGEPNVCPKELFDRTFHDAVNDIAATLVGRRRFHRLQFQPVADPLCVPGSLPRSPQLPDGYLTGASGGLAILLAQVLANRRTGRWRGHWYALPPWVVVTATLDQKAEGRACPVGAVEAKIRLLREEGVRLVVIADETAHLTAVKSVLNEFSDRHGMATLRAGRKPEQLAARLIAEQCAWETNIEKPPVVSRRAFIGAAATAVLGVAAGAYLFSDRRQQTRAMRAHSLALLREKTAEVKQYAAHAGMEAYFRDVLRATRINDAPSEVSFNGLRVLYDGKFFDSTDWEPVPSIEDLARSPIEATYFTRVLQLQKHANPPSKITAEFNTTGFGVIPVLDPARPHDRVYHRERRITPGVVSKTTSLVIDISQLGNDGQPFELVVRAIWFNGAQDQRLRRDSEGRPVGHDWWGHRVDPRTEKADLAVRLPQHKPFGSVKRMASQRRRIHGTDQILVPYREIREGDPLWAPAEEVPDVTYTKGTDSVWVIPCYPVEDDLTWWVYAIQWRWTT
jgi:hypothetical protein